MIMKLGEEWKGGKKRSKRLGGKGKGILSSPGHPCSRRVRRGCIPVFDLRFRVQLKDSPPVPSAELGSYTFTESVQRRKYCSQYYSHDRHSACYRRVGSRRSTPMNCLCRNISF